MTDVWTGIKHKDTVSVIRDLILDYPTVSRLNNEDSFLPSVRDDVVYNDSVT